ncbi:hypothetical protein WBJ53_01250 [Spirosoma sp. SC4-14]|uniref:hypothetical protein n=1 Tax=Spirosoma sp. SC4-14 TaxID=3128900 RepID=UPI0030D4E5F8
MRKKILVCVFVFLCQHGFSQEIPPLQIGFNFSTDIVQALYIGQAVETAQKVSAFERPYWGIEPGINIVGNFNDRIGAEIGVHYARTGINVVIPDKNNVFQSDYVRSNYFFINVPLRLNYRIPISRLSILVSTGCSVSWLFKFNGFGKIYNQKVDFNYVYVAREARLNNSYIPDNQRDVWSYQFSDEGSENRKLNILPVVSIGIEYQINEKASIRFEPVLKYTLFNTGKDKIQSRVLDYSTGNSSASFTTSQQHLWSFGVNVGLYFPL